MPLLHGCEDGPNWPRGMRHGQSGTCFGAPPRSARLGGGSIKIAVEVASKPPMKPTILATPGDARNPRKWVKRLHFRAWRVAMCLTIPLACTWLYDCAMRWNENQRNTARGPAHKGRDKSPRRKTRHSAMIQLTPQQHSHHNIDSDANNISVTRTCPITARDAARLQASGNSL